MNLQFFLIGAHRICVNQRDLRENKILLQISQMFAD